MCVSVGLEHLPDVDTRDPRDKLLLETVSGVNISGIYCSVPMTTIKAKSPSDEYPFVLTAVQHQAKNARAHVEVDNRVFTSTDISLVPCSMGGVALGVGEWLRISFPDRESANALLLGLARALAALVPEAEELP